MQTTTKKLEQAVSDYLLWMISSGYSHQTWQLHEHTLNRFQSFITEEKIAWDKIFTLETLKDFQKQNGNNETAAIRRMSRYLCQQKRILQPIAKKEYWLPEIYEDYLSYYARTMQVHARQIKRIKRVLAAFDAYLKKSKINLPSITIEHIDAFFAKFNSGFAPSTCKVYRTFLRGFLRYLYHERKILKRDLALLVVGAPMFAQAKPPTFLRPHDVQKVFDGIDCSSQTGLRTYAMLQLAYTLGLRPKEICQITLDDISFTKGELSIKDRKCDNPLKLPLPEITTKAIEAYIIGARQQSGHRTLFLSLNPPYGPITPTTVNHHFKILMQEVSLPSTAYWLRHTYAQNLLEAGVSIYEIKELLGHDTIESTRKYLLIHIKLMREVLFDEKV